MTMFQTQTQTQTQISDTYNILHPRPNTNSIESNKFDIFINSIRSLTNHPVRLCADKYDELCTRFHNFMQDAHDDGDNMKSMFKLLCVSVGSYDDVGQCSNNLNNFVAKALSYYKQFYIYCTTITCKNIHNTHDVYNVMHDVACGKYIVKQLDIVREFYAYVHEFIPYVNYGNHYNLTRVVYDVLGYYQEMYGGIDFSSVRMRRLDRMTRGRGNYVLDTCTYPVLRFVDKDAGRIMIFDIGTMEYEIKTVFRKKTRSCIMCLLCPLYLVTYAINSLGRVRINIRL